MHALRLTFGAISLVAIVFGLQFLQAAALDQVQPPGDQLNLVSMQKMQSRAESMRVIIVEWRIKKGREREFLDYWSKRSTIPDRLGLIGEFLSRVDDRNNYPWMVWNFDEGWSTFLNVGFWREGADFQQQVGRFIDNTRPPMAFEADRRRRVLLAPERWRLGGTALPLTDHVEVQ
jgi:hypothetical protein